MERTPIQSFALCFLNIFMFKSVYILIYIHILMYLSAFMSVQMPEGVRSHGAGITEGCETLLPLTNVDARNQTGLFCKFSCG